MKKRLLALAMCMAMAFTTVGCGDGADSTTAAGSEAGSEAVSEAGSEAAPSGSSTVVVAMGAGFSTLDPGYVYEKNPPVIINACYENLFKFYSNEGAPEPCLADTYEFSEDGLTLTVTMNYSVLSII